MFSIGALSKHVFLLVNAMFGTCWDEGWVEFKLVLFGKDSLFIWQANTIILVTSNILI